MRLTRKQLFVVASLSGMSEDALTKGALTGAQAHAVISAARLPELEYAIRRTEDELRAFAAVPENLGARVVRYRKAAGIDGEGGQPLPPSEFDGQPASEDAPAVAAKPEAKPISEGLGDPEAIIKERAAHILGVVQVLNDGALGNVSGALDVIQDMAREMAARALAAQKPAAFVAPGAVSAEYITPAWFSDAVTVLGAPGQLDLLLIGPAGTGKTRAGLELAKALGKPCTMFDFRADMRRGDVFFSQQIVDGETVYALAPFLESVQRDEVTVINEPFSLDPERMLAFNGLFESGQRSISTPLGVIKRHEGNRIVLASNTAGRSESRLHKGPQAQDSSTLSRVVPMRIDVDPKVEKGMARLAGLSPKDGAWVVAQVRALRTAVDRAQLCHEVTPRAITQIGALVGAGMGRERAANMVLLGALELSERAKVQAALDPALVSAKGV